jgi:acetoin utilization protein AcuB
MRAKDILSKHIMPLKPSDTGSLALQWMEDFGVNQLPLVEGDAYMGLVKAEDLFNQDDQNETLDPHKLPLQRAYVYDYQHFYEVLRLVSAEKLSLIAVLNEENKYVGCINLSEIISAMASFTGVQQPGGILVLEVSPSGYSMSEISRIIEANDAKVLSAFITSPPESSKLEVTMKVSVMDLSSIIQTFNRYDYIVKASFAEESSYDALLSERYASLLKYLST